MSTLDGWIITARDDEVKARPKDASDRLFCESVHSFVIEVGGVKVPITQDQAFDLYGDLAHCFMEQEVA